MPFLDDLETRYMGGGQDMVIHELKYRLRHTDDIIVVPIGFNTDFASIPRMFRFLITGQDNTKKPAVVHDYLYHTKKGSRAWADKVFLEAMSAEGVRWWKRQLAYAGVRAGGWVVWNAK